MANQMTLFNECLGEGCSSPSTNGLRACTWLWPWNSCYDFHLLGGLKLEVQSMRGLLKGAVTLPVLAFLLFGVFPVTLKYF